MESLLRADLNLRSLEAEFPSFKFYAYASSDQSIVCFACFNSSMENILSNWESIQSIIAGKFQATDNRAKWNYYLAFFTPEKLPITEIYRIQNDRFCSRKLIFDKHVHPFDAEHIQQILSRDILGSSLQLDPRQTPEQFISSLSEILTSVPLSHNPIDKEKRRAILSNLIGT